MKLRAAPALAVALALPLSGCQPAVVPTDGPLPTDAAMPVPTPTHTPAPATVTPDVDGPSAPNPPAGPSARGYHRMVGVGGERGVLLLSGFNGDGPPSVIPSITAPDGAWAFTPAGGWTDLGLVGYEEMPTLNDAVYHPGAGRVVLIAMGPTSVLPAVVSGTYLYDPTTNEIEAKTSEGPPALIGSRAAYDSESDRVIVFGGLTFSARHVDGTWAYDVDSDTWTQMSPEVSPPARNYHAMAYHPGADRVVMFGGCCAGDDGLGDTWTYDYNTDTWTEVGSPGPAPRTYAAMVYDPVTDQMILFGGAATWERGPTFNDTWAYDVETDTWTELSPPSTPDTRAWHTLAADPDAGVIVLFGGGPSREEYTAETWLFDPAANSWTLVHQTASPGAALCEPPDVKAVLDFGRAAPRAWPSRQTETSS